MLNCKGKEKRLLNIEMNGQSKSQGTKVSADSFFTGFKKRITVYDLGFRLSETDMEKTSKIGY